MSDDDLKRLVTAAESIARSLEELTALAQFNGEILTAAVEDLTTTLRKEHKHGQ